MRIDGNYSQIGKDMLLALQSANQDQQIERHELAQLRQAAYTDGHLSAGEAQLLQQLELLTQDGQSVQNLELAAFDPAALEFGELTLRVQGNQAVAFPAEELLTRHGANALRESANLMDLGQSIESARTTRQSPPAYFNHLSSQLQAQSRELAALITQAQQINPPAEQTVQQLRQMQALTHQLAEIQAHWARSTDGGTGQQDAAESRARITQAQTLLAQLDPAVIGEDTHARLSAVLQHQATLTGRYDAEHNRNLLWANENLGAFVMRQTSPAQTAALTAEQPVGPPLDPTHSLENFNSLQAVSQGLTDQQAAAETRIQTALAPHLNQASPALRQYLEDPSQLSGNDMANVREEFANLFKNNPALAGRVSQELASLQTAFPALRQRLEDQLVRAQSHGQEAQAHELRAQLRALADTESRVVRNWQDSHQLLLEGLAVAAQASTAVASQTADARNWINETQNRYARTMLQDPQNQETLAAGFEASLSLPEAAGIRDKIERTTARYGQPELLVPMVLATADTGATLNFNAYVYRDRNGYIALNPLDQKLYRGASPEEALAALGRDSRMMAGQLHFSDGRQLQQFEMQPPEDRSTWDLVMAGAGLMGAGVMIFLPEPTTTAAGLALGASILAVGASSGYFVHKGATQMHELIQNDNFGNNRDTWMAAFDMASGLLGVASAAGAGARLSLQTVRVEHALTQSLARLGTSRGLIAAELGDGLAGVGLAAEQIVDIVNNPQLSDREKQTAIAQIVMFTATPFMLSGAVMHNRRHDLSQQQLQRSHLEQMESLHNLHQTLDAARAPEVIQTARENMTPRLNDMEVYYRSDAFERNPALREEGLGRIAEFRTRLENLMPAQSQVHTDLSRMAVLPLGELNVTGVREISTTQPPRRIAHFSAELSAGLSQTQAREAVQAQVRSLVQHYEGNGLRVRDADAMPLELLNAAGDVAIRIRFKPKDHGSIEIQDFQPNPQTVDRITYRSPAPPAADAGPSFIGARESDGAWRSEPNRAASGLPAPNQLAAMRGQNTAQMGDFRNIRGLSISEILARIPAEAQFRELDPRPNNLSGFEYTWHDNGALMKVRIHGPDSSAPPGSNARQGWVAIVERGEDRLGPVSGGYDQWDWFSKTQRTEFEFIGNETHIPIAGNPVLSTQP